MTDRTPRSRRPFGASLLLLTLTCAVALVLAACASDGSAPAPGASSNPKLECDASSTWITNPSLPTEVEPDQGNATRICNFYQFGWQAFLYLMSDQSGGSGDRMFQNASDYPVFQGIGKDSCSDSATGPQLFVRDVKPVTAEASEFTLPENITQAQSGDAIYDQHGNAVFYGVYFSDNLCNASTTGNLPDGTTEIKTSWRIMTDDDTPSEYFTMDTEIDLDSGGTATYTLGMVGFHLFRTTADHPEGVWLTWEHQKNAPPCLADSENEDDWSFTSKDCSECLLTSDEGPIPCSDCNFNQAQTANNSTLTGGTPTEICRVYRYGTGPVDTQETVTLESYQNVSNLTDINGQLVGSGGLLATYGASNGLDVLENYFLVGGVWLNDKTQDDSFSNQRGSLQLANTTMETTFQGTYETDDTRTNAKNCFGCHTYTVDNTATSNLSHIFPYINGNTSSASLLDLD